MGNHPKILRIETGLLSQESKSSDVLDYEVYQNIPRIYRKFEELLRLDIFLAFKAKSMEQNYDILCARSEKVGIPLSFFSLKKPLVVYGHHLESPLKAKFVKYSKISNRWAALGYTSIQCKIFYEDYFGFPSSKLFQFESAKYLDQPVAETYAQDGPMMSIGVAKRDYRTLLLSLVKLPDYPLNLFVSSRFGDTLSRDIRREIPKSVKIMGFVSQEELMDYYRKARFVIIPLRPTTQNSVGINAVLEACAFGKAIIATRVGGMPFYVRDGETGILVPPNDVEAMQNAIVTLWNQPELAHRMGLAGRKYVEDFFNPKNENENISILMESIYENGTREKHIS